MPKNATNKREHPKPIRAKPLWSLQRTIKECLKQQKHPAQKAWEVSLETQEEIWVVTLQKHQNPSTKLNGFSQILSARELEVLELLAKGFTAQDISRQLDIAYDTVRTHRRNLRRKLGIRERSARSLLQYQSWWKKLS